LGSCALVGGYVYRGAEYSNLWSKYFYSDECTNAIGLHSIDKVGNNFYDSLALAHGGAFVSFGEDKHGELYIADYGGLIYKIRGAACSPVAVIHSSDTILACDGTPMHLYAPEGRGFHYQWLVNGNPSGTDSSGLEITSAGDYFVVVTDRNGCSSTSAIVNILPCVGIDENAPSFSISIFPNPNNGEFTLSLNNTTNADFSNLEIEDVLGKIVFKKRLALKKEIHLQCTLAKSVYTLKLYNNEFSSVKTFVVN
jgi:hypothetical protein